MPLASRMQDDLLSHSRSLSRWKQLDRPRTSLTQYKTLLRDALMEAIQLNDGTKIEKLARGGAPLLVCYPTEDSPASTPLKYELVNPVDWAALKLRFGAAAQLLGISGHFLALDLDRESNVREHNVASETKYAVSLAARHGNLTVLGRLLDQSADPGQRDASRSSALLLAMRHGHVEAAALLLQHGAWTLEEQRGEVEALARTCNLQASLRVAGTTQQISPNPPRNIADCTNVPLDTSSYQPGKPHLPLPPPKNDAALAPRIFTRRQAWYKEGAPVAIWQESLPAPSSGTNYLDHWGWTPSTSLPITQTLAHRAESVQSQCSDQSRTNRSGVGNAESVAAPLPEISADALRLRGELRRAIRKGDLDRLHALVARGAPLTATFEVNSGERGTCVECASASNHLECALALLEHADKQGTGSILAKTSCSALFCAVANGQLSLLKALLDRSADVSKRHGPKQDTLLSVAIHSVRPAETLELLRRGAWKYESPSDQNHLFASARSWPELAKAFDDAGLTESEATRNDPLLDDQLLSKWLQVSNTESTPTHLDSALPSTPSTMAPASPAPLAL
eukprot:TRINITY_DN89075_c0_g1_i1.p1 TRINITY_DN89075_c0_g1~~TRINITY_DN89075_c0_g1_i1.p1  ORF type:complete len:568 (-),score=66.05 TRINITY_DN89075_c0_g1_i1:112-1815(-)